MWAGHLWRGRRVTSEILGSGRTPKADSRAIFCSVASERTPTIYRPTFVKVHISVGLLPSHITDLITFTALDIAMAVN